MTRDEAISLIRRYKRDTFFMCNVGRWPRFLKRKNSRVAIQIADIRWKISVYGQFLCNYLIDKIEHSNSDPIEEVYKLYSLLDDVLGDSADDHFVTHKFAAIMENQTGHILRYLRSKEDKNDKIGR